MVTLAGAGAVNEEYAQGSVYATGSKGIMAHAVRRDANSVLTGTADGDVTPFLVDGTGLLKMRMVATDVSLGGILPYNSHGAADLNNTASRGFVSIAALTTASSGLLINKYGGTLPAFSRMGISVNVPYSTTLVYAPLQIWYGPANINSVSDSATMSFGANTNTTVDWSVPSGQNLYVKRAVVSGATTFPAGSYITVRLFN